jgi:deazaflavin-dependent oxidoreductase (nitroreductase family)
VLYRLSGGRFLWTTSNKRGWGALRLTTIGRKSGKERSVIIGYVEEGPNLVALAMNGWDEGHPSWWLNLEAHPDAVVRLAGQHQRPVCARPAAEDERARLWQRWVAVDPQIDRTPACGRPRRPRSSWNRATGLLDPGEDGSSDQIDHYSDARGWPPRTCESRPTADQTRQSPPLGRPTVP